MKDLFRDWENRLSRRMVTLAVMLSAGLVFAVLRHGFEMSNPLSWLLLLLGGLSLVNFLYLGWWLYFSPEAGAPKPAPSQIRQQRILAVADTVDDLPSGISLADLCEKLDEKQTRKLLHQMQQTRPGNRHLRDTAHLWPHD